MPTEQENSSETLREALADVNESLDYMHDELKVVANSVLWSVARQELADAFVKLQAAILVLGVAIDRHDGGIKR